MKKGIIVTVLVIAFAFVVAVFYNLTRGFTTEVKNFALVYRGEYILNDTGGIDIREVETFEVKGFGKDSEKIEAKLVPIEIADDLRFYIGDYEYSWNQHVVRAEDPSKLFTVRVDQDKDTVQVSGKLLNVLQAYAKEYVGEGKVRMRGKLPNADMFRLEVTTGDSTISVGCRLLSSVTGISLDKTQYNFGG